MGSAQRNRQLTQEEITALFHPLFEEVKGRLAALSEGDAALLWALRRKLTKELGYEERGKPGERKLLKARKFGEQAGKCARCQGPLPEKGAVLDRVEAMEGYTLQNTRLLCPACDSALQAERGYH